jgi:endonuclease/exonuclease/phosphatase family metal-dependent hydrolase
MDTQLARPTRAARKHRMRVPARRRLVAALVAFLMVVPAAAVSAAPGSSNRDREVTVMSRNLYLGASLGPLTEATEETTLAAVRAVWAQVQATSYPLRAKALAAEIVEEGPLLVGLQEVTTYRQRPFGGPAPDDDVVLDYLQILLDELAERGTPYRVIASVENFDGELPHVGGTPESNFFLRLTDRDVIIARGDARTSELKVLGTDSENFDAALSLPIGGVSTPIVRGWVSADVKHRGQTFRFVNTHPEAFSPVINADQIAELVGGPLATTLPTVLVGDLNAIPTSASMAPIFAAGFADTALTAATRDAGPTCCFNDTVTGGTLTSRIDYVLYRGRFDAVAQRRTGLAPVNGLYPSDHAGVVADLLLPPGLSAPGRKR